MNEASPRDLFFDVREYQFGCADSDIYAELLEQRNVVRVGYHRNSLGYAK